MEPDNRRKYFRVETAMPTRWKVLKENEIRLIKNGMGSSLLKDAGLPNPIDEFIKLVTPGSKEEQLYHCFQLINNKLDYIVDQLSSQSSDGPASQNDIVEISASGLKFCVREALEIGTFLRMNVIMPGTSQYEIEFIAKVLRIKKKDNLFIAAAKIVEIDEDAKDAIIKIVFEMQRRTIRRKKEN